MKVDLRQIKGRCQVNPRTGCWEWANCTQGNGYGRIAVDGKTMYVHRYVFLLVHGEIRHGVCRTCNTRRCCNPDHLFDGTRRDNAQNAKHKGRTSCGLRHSVRTTLSARRRTSTKLTIEAAREIRARRAAGEKTADIAAAFAVSTSNVNLIVRGKAWRDSSPFFV